MEVAAEAGQILLAMSATGISSKSSPTDLVTDADRRAEAHIFERIRNARPDDTIRSEEGSVFEGTSGVEWIIDPLDGTTNYAYAIPQWAVSIGIEGAVRAGVVHDPSRGETFTDSPGLVPSDKTDLATSLIGTGFSYSSEMRAKQGAIASRVLPLVRDLRRAGSCALDLAWVACGRLDGFYEDDTHPWDRSAGIAIIEGAGGHVRTYDGLTIAAGTLELLEKLESLVK